MYILELVTLCLIITLTNVTPSRTNVALRRKAIMAASHPTYSADKAVDGSAEVFFSVHCVHGRKDATWIAIDLGRIHQIGEVVITSSNYYASTLDFVFVHLSASTYEASESSPPNPESQRFPCGQYATVAPQMQKLRINCPANVPPARFVIIEQADQSRGFLTLCEVEVYETTDIDKKSFVGCYENFLDGIELDASPFDVLSCQEGCLGNNATFFSVKENGCTCGNEPTYSKFCDTNTIEVFAVCPDGLYGANCSRLCRVSSKCDEEQATCPNLMGFETRMQECDKENVSSAHLGCIKNDGKNLRKSFVVSNQSCLSLCKMRGFDFAGMRMNICLCLNAPMNFQNHCGDKDFFKVYAVCPLGKYGYNCSRSCFCDQSKPCSYLTGRCPGGCEEGWTGVSCNERDCTAKNGLCGENSKCMVINNRSICACNVGFTRPTFHSKCEVIRDSHTPGIVVGTLVGLMALVVLALLLYRLRKKITFRKYSKKSKTAYYSKQISPEHLKASHETDNPTDGRLKLSGLPDYVAANSQYFAEEFRSIPMITSQSRSYGLQKHLKLKNKFRNIIPYDHNRVILKQLLDNESSDYINASYVTGWSKTIIIASQGPTVQNIHDFWRMIGEQQVGLVVMLCSLNESKKGGCSQYWPSAGNACFGGYNIQFESEFHARGCYQRSFTLQTPMSARRKVVQLQFTLWPDQGVPEDILNFLSFHKRFRISLNDKRCTSLIHCSAGAGRTGCFLGVDCLLGKASEDGCLDVPGCVRMLRGQRSYMVENLTQYEFLYNSLVVKSSMGDILFGREEYLDYFRSYGVKVTEQIMNQFEMVLQNHYFSDRDRYSIERMDPIYFMSYCGKYKFVITCDSDLANVVALLFRRYKTIIAFDPNQIILSIFSSTDVDLDEHRKLILQEIVETNFGTKIVINKTTFSNTSFKNVSGCSNQLVINLFDETIDDPYVRFNRIYQLYKQVIKLKADDCQEILIFNLSESDMAGVFVSFTCVCGAIDSRAEVDIYDQVVLLHEASKKLLVKTLSSYQDLHQYAFNYLLQIEK